MQCQIEHAVSYLFRLQYTQWFSCDNDKTMNPCVPNTHMEHTILRYICFSELKLLPRGISGYNMQLPNLRDTELRCEESNEFSHIRQMYGDKDSDAHKIVDMFAYIVNKSCI